MRITRILFTAGVMLASMSALAQFKAAPRMASTASLKTGEVYYTYDDGESTLGYWGSGKTESYDVAIHLSDAGLVGKTVEGLVITFGTDQGISDCSAWLSKELTLASVDNKKKNVPDILSQDVEVKEGEIEVRFSQPYTVTDGDFYAGYSFTVSAVDTLYNQYPLLMTTNYDDEGLYIHSSRSYRKWVAKGSATGAALAMKVIVGGVAQDVASVSVPASAGVQKEEQHELTLTFQNHGSSEVSNVDYQYTLNGQTYSDHLDFATPLPVRYGASADATITLPAVSEPGEYDMVFSVTKVNGKANAEASLTSNCVLKVYRYLPKHRPVMEEYTGFWCGWCTRGFFAMEKMNKLYPDDFIAISIHNSDSIEVMSSSKYPSSISGFPGAYLERRLDVDPYYGTGNSGFQIENDWLSLRDEVAPAGIDVEGVVAEDGNTLNVTANTTFISSYDNAHFHVEYCVVADDLYNPNWLQHNYYPSYYTSYAGTELEELCDWGTTVALHFNDVLVAASYASHAGSANSALPKAITAYEPYATSCSFKMNQVKNTKGEILVNDTTKFAVVALLVNDETGYIENASKAYVDNTITSINHVANDALTDERVSYFDLSGRRIQKPTSGIYIERDAKGKATKHVIR